MIENKFENETRMKVFLHYFCNISHNTFYLWKLKDFKFLLDLSDELSG